MAADALVSMAQSIRRLKFDAMPDYAHLDGILRDTLIQLGGPTTAEDDAATPFEWEAGDIIYVPPNTIHQHVNADPERPARLISSTNRIFKQCGLNDLEQIENAPEYQPGMQITPEFVRNLLRGETS